MTDFYGQDLAAVHADAFEALAAAAATLLKALPADASGQRILDLGCGAGPLSQRLGDRGFTTWGLDLSPALIALAQARAPQAEFHCGSVLDADLPRAIGVAAIGEVFNYATARDPGDLPRAFQRVFDTLEPGGVFLFDLAGPGRVGVGRSFTEAASWAVGVVSTEAGGQLLRKITTFRDAGGGAWNRAYEEHLLQLWAPADVLAQLAACGFEAEELPGYEGLPMPPALHAYSAVKSAR